MNSYVYWIFDENCKDVNTDGYVGVSKDPFHRHKVHIKQKRVPLKSYLKIIFEGQRENCFAYEKHLRPYKNIGWNNAAGGCHGFKIGFFHSDETKLKLKEKWTEERKYNASLFRKEQNKKLIGQKREKQSLAMLGENNPMFGTKRPESVKIAISIANKNKIPINKQELYCIHCRQRHSLFILNKYHGKNRKNCIK